jgi:hypothetical protein
VNRFVRLEACRQSSSVFSTTKVPTPPISVRTMVCVCGGLPTAQSQVVQLLRRVGKVEHAEALVQPIVPAPAGFGYRNKMDFAYGPGPSRASSTSTSTSAPASGSAVLGLKRHGSHDDIVDVASCPLQSDAGNRALAAVRALAPSGGGVATCTALRRCIIRVAHPPKPDSATADAGAHVMVRETDRRHTPAHRHAPPPPASPSALTLSSTVRNAHWDLPVDLPADIQRIAVARHIPDTKVEAAACRIYDPRSAHRGGTPNTPGVQRSALCADILRGVATVGRWYW